MVGILGVAAGGGRRRLLPRFAVCSKASLLTAFAVLSGLPCAAQFTVFSVRNPTPVPWDLVDVTKASSASSHVFGTLPPNPGPDADPVQAAGNRFTVAAGTTLSGNVDAAPAPGLAEAEALRRDLAESAMFLGNEEGQLLAGYLGLAVDANGSCWDGKEGVAGSGPGASRLTACRCGRY
jgi:hypothetical protein